MRSDRSTDQAGASFARVREVYLAVSELPSDDRERELLRLCGGDAVLRRKVLRMLDAVTAGLEFLAHPATLDGLTFLPDGDIGAIRVPETIGPYRIGELLGEGGFGSVYRARQDAPIRREVAIKVIKPGMDTRSVVARFEAERQTLALLQHANIAQVFDAGATAEGRPYFVMELIIGEPLTDYCNARRLSVEARIGLFIDVCRAVEHAHQKGVIHRDLKPSNVLVQEHAPRPIVKVIDFGIARAIGPSLEDAARLTLESQLIGTPDYMSPEQVEGARGADTRVDIYALGVMFYELLTGRTPLGLASRGRLSPSAIAETIRHEEPKRPSAQVATLASDAADVASARGTDARRLRSRLDGDLDWIALKAIEKDANRRYDSVGALIADLERHLAHEPVSAARPSSLYAIGKFVRRHRIGVVAVGGIILSLGIGLVMTTLSLQRAVQAESNLRLARDQAVAVNGFLVDDLLGAAGTNREGHTVTVVQAMQNAIPRVDARFANEPVLSGRVKHAIGSVFRDIGMLPESVTPLREAVDAFERELGSRHASTIDAKITLGDALRELGRDEEAEAVLRPAAEAMESALGPNDLLTLRIKGSLGEILQKRGRYTEADALLRDTIERMERLGAPSDEALLKARISLVASLGAQLRDEEALPYAKAVLDQTRASFPRTHPAVLAATNHYALALSNLKRHAEAELVFHELIATLESVMPPGHWHIALSRYSLAMTIDAQGRRAEALPLLEQAVEEATAALGPDHEFVRVMVVEREKRRAGS